MLNSNFKRRKGNENSRDVPIRCDALPVLYYDSPPKFPNPVSHPIPFHPTLSYLILASVLGV